MNLDMFSNIDGLVLREQNAVPYADRSEQMMPMSDTPDMPEDPKLAMAYVPFQQWGNAKSPEDALSCGTLFTDLVFPFERGGSK